MSAIVPVSANMGVYSDATYERYAADIQIGALKVVYPVTVGGVTTVQLASNASTAQASAVGITLHQTNADQSVIVLKSGGIDLGLDLSILENIGDDLYLGTNGEIIPKSDLANPNSVTRIGNISEARRLEVKIDATGVVFT